VLVEDLGEAPFSIFFDRLHTTPNIPYSQNAAKTRSGKELRRLTFKFYLFVERSFQQSSVITMGAVGQRKFCMPFSIRHERKTRTWISRYDRKGTSSCASLLSAALLSMTQGATALNRLFKRSVDSPWKRIGY
jgi:hypothetical protein